MLLSDKQTEHLKFDINKIIPQIIKKTEIIKKKIGCPVPSLPNRIFL